MKAIVVIKSAKGKARSLLRHCYLAVGRQGVECPSLTEEDDRVIGIINGLTVGAVLRKPAPDARNLIPDLPAGRAEIRHVILSFEETADPEARLRAMHALAEMVPQFASKYAPGTAYIGVLHQDRLHPHAHIVFANTDADNLNCLAWDRDTLKEMQSMTWVDAETTAAYDIECGRGQGRSVREGTQMPYPALTLDALYAASTIARQLEQDNSPQLFTTPSYDTPRNPNPIPANKTGTINFNGRKISWRTLRNMAAYIPNAPATGYKPVSTQRQRVVRVVSHRSPSTPEIG